MPEIIQNQPESTQKPTRRKKNKETHNAVERHRKEKINAGIKRIGDLLPCSQALKQSKNMILGEAFRYITELKQQNDEMLLNGGDKVQAEEIKRLRQQVEDLRKESAHYIELLKANGINFLDDPTIHWKGKQRCAKCCHRIPKACVLLRRYQATLLILGPVQLAAHRLHGQHYSLLATRYSLSVELWPQKPVTLGIIFHNCQYVLLWQIPKSIPFLSKCKRKFLCNCKPPNQHASLFGLTLPTCYPLCSPVLKHLLLLRHHFYPRPLWYFINHLLYPRQGY
ncbi:hypothetical protein PGIGA_G00136130 [Pangasianodon gigas]|uniref:Uncharacterized protein n=1 Tax=Pangasianodon gigas TaxID=30993 RepID=A0ACC5XK58_PANGG|nr:hypothetical protein [Pangasianodon gigas]